MSTCCHSTLQRFAYDFHATSRANRDRRRVTMAAEQHVYIGTDGGATTSKVGAVWHDGTVVSTRLLQRPTRSADGPAAVIEGWVNSIHEYLQLNQLT